MTSTNYFDAHADSWDTPHRINIAADIVKEIIRKIDLHRDMTVLDFGAGTGLISSALSIHVGRITAVDSSPGMLNILEKKIACQNLRNVTIYHKTGNSTPAPAGSLDLIVSSMTLHHVEDTEGLLGEFYGYLKTGGVLAVADLDSEAGDFHRQDAEIFHRGFNREHLEIQCQKAGFKNIRVNTATIISKTTEKGEEKDFPVFLLIAEK